MRKVWNKGLTKATNASLQKTSETMRRKKLDNFARWRTEAKTAGIIRSEFSPFKKDGDFAELLGVMLGDGHIQKFPRTERLLIFSNSNNTGFINRYTELVEKLFSKEPYVYQQTGTNCTRISLYEKYISKRIGMPTGPRKNLVVSVPGWILRSRKHIKRYLRGLYEAEGSYSVHLPTSTHKLNFANTNQSMLKNVVKLLTVLGFSPHWDQCRVQLSKKSEVEQAIRELEFRKY